MTCGEVIVGLARCRDVQDARPGDQRESCGNGIMFSGTGAWDAICQRRSSGHSP